MGLSTDKSLGNFVCSCSDVKSQRRCQHCTWQILLGVWVCLELTEPLWWQCNQISQSNENHSSLWASSPFKGYQEKSRANGTRKEMREQGAGKESESLSFPLSLTALSLFRAFTCHSKWRGCCQFITFLCSHACLLFSEPVTFGIPRKNSSYLHTKQHPLWLHISFVNHFNQPLISNNIATFTCVWHKKSSRTGTHNMTMPNCMPQWCLVWHFCQPFEIVL